VDVLYGRKGGSSISLDSPKWIESYTMPGQFVALRFSHEEGDGGSPSQGLRVASRLYSLASSPYESRRDSYNYDASIIEVRAPLVRR
jgi:ferredoxin-NADP reductase